MTGLNGMSVTYVVCVLNVCINIEKSIYIVKKKFSSSSRSSSICLFFYTRKKKFNINLIIINWLCKCKIISNIYKNKSRSENVSAALLF